MLVESYADRVLGGAALKPGMTLVDLGAGDGLVAFRAFDRVGASLKVILVDISLPLLKVAEQTAESRGVWEQCTFLEAPAERLGELKDNSVDAVTTRSLTRTLRCESASGSSNLVGDYRLLNRFFAIMLWLRLR